MTVSKETIYANVEFLEVANGVNLYEVSVTLRVYGETAAEALVAVVDTVGELAS